MTKLIHPITFIDKLVKKNERGEAFTLADHQREVLRLAFDFDQDGRLPRTRFYIPVVLRKSGKTAINAALHWAGRRALPKDRGDCGKS